MSAPENFEVLEDHAVFRPVGEMTLYPAAAMVTAAIAYAREQGIRKLLVVTTNLTGFGPPTIAQRYDIVEKWAEAARAAVRVAMVLHPAMIDPDKFGMLVAVNRGLTSDVFTTEAEALAWLRNLE